MSAGMLPPPGQAGGPRGPRRKRRYLLHAIANFNPNATGDGTTDLGRLIAKWNALPDRVRTLDATATYRHFERTLPAGAWADENLRLHNGDLHEGPRSEGNGDPHAPVLASYPGRDAAHRFRRRRIR